jgi:hypothetical protein
VFTAEVWREKMKVDFDSLRKQLAQKYNNLYREFDNLSVVDTAQAVNVTEALINLRGYIGAILSLESEEGDVFNSINLDLLPLDGDD